jgi:hypothetical protein
MTTDGQGGHDVEPVASAAWPTSPAVSPSGNYSGVWMSRYEYFSSGRDDTWLGFGNDLEINSGPWELIFRDASTSRATLDAYNRRPAVAETEE